MDVAEGVAVGLLAAFVLLLVLAAVGVVLRRWPLSPWMSFSDAMWRYSSLAPFWFSGFFWRYWLAGAASSLAVLAFISQL